MSYTTEFLLYQKKWNGCLHIINEINKIIDYLHFDKYGFYNLKNKISYNEQFFVNVYMVMGLMTTKDLNDILIKELKLNLINLIDVIIIIIIIVIVNGSVKIIFILIKRE